MLSSSTQEQSRDWHLWSFGMALFIYGVWGSPTPNNPNWVEVMIAILLVFAIGFKPLYQTIRIRPFEKTQRWRAITQFFFLWGLFVPLSIGLLKASPLDIIFRDVVGFIFLCFPLFIVDFLTENEKRRHFFLYFCFVIGILFSIRVLVPHFLLFRNTTELLYLANSPLVLMSALYLCAAAGYSLYQKISYRGFVKASCFIALAALPVMAMFVDLQRASFAALVLSFIFLFVLGVIKTPFKMIVPAMVLVVGGIMIEPYLTDIVQSVGLKTSQVGLNMRAQEVRAVWENLSFSGWSILFGQGWGSSFASPAVGMLNITYTHSLLSYIFLKMGLIGLMICLTYLFVVFQKLVLLYRHNPIAGTAFIWPFLIPVLLYASHKSFDFGLLLSLIIVSCSASQVKGNFSVK